MFGGFLFGVPRKLIKRVTEIEIDTHYYDTDVVPSAQNIFTYTINTENKIATITGFAVDDITKAVMPYRIQYGDKMSELFASTEYIKEGSFKDCSYLVSMTIPNTIDKISSQCFMNCTSLTTVNIPKSVKSIESESFAGCSQLNTLIIPCTTETLGENAFKDCTNLGSLLIPYAVNNIADNTFDNCPNLKIICYKNSYAEDYAIEHDIPYSLISYTLDEDITQNSENLVTSGVVYKHVQNLLNKINAHINNKNNPHDDSTFNNSTITQGTLINILDTDESLINKGYVDNLISEVHNPSEGYGYQTIYDSNLKTESKTVVGAINELNNAVNTVSGTLSTGWNTVSLNTLYPISWRFLDKPYCYTDDGIAVDFRVKNLPVSNDNIINNYNTFDIYVPIDCNYTLSTTSNNQISGIPINYLILEYYYTGLDGTDLDTVTELSNDWPIDRHTIGWGHSPNTPITNDDGKVLIQFSGDNRGGGSDNADVKYYESVYFNIKEIQSIIPNEDIEITLYAGWYANRGNGNININLKTFISDVEPTVVDNGDTLSLNVNGVTLQPNYQNKKDTICNISNSIKGQASNYKNSYTPAFRLIFHKTTNDSNYRTVSIIPLS